MKKALSYLLVGLMGVGITLTLVHWTNNASDNRQSNISAIETPVQFTRNYSPGMPQAAVDFTQAAEETVHAVVHITTEYERKPSFYDYFYDWKDFFGQQQQPHGKVIASGSGVIISDDGYIVTNNHVVQDANKVTVTLNDKRTFKAEVIGTDPSTDLALLKVDERQLPYVRYGNSDDVQIGEWVLAVGNPFNLTSTVTAGIVSAKARNINILDTPDGSSAIESFIQTDAAVNRGNSGGALVNTRGQLIGINAAIASGTGYYAGYSFAIPVNLVRKVMNDLMEYGGVQRAYLGITINELNSEIAAAQGIDELNGVYVNGIAADGAAESAGIEAGDVITGINGHPVNSTSELLELIGQYRPGSVVRVKVSRNNQEKEYTLTLRNRYGDTKIVKRSENNDFALLGARMKAVSAELKSELDIEYGMQVIELDKGKLSNAGIREGFIITQIDKQPIRNRSDIMKTLSNKRGGVLIEGVYPNRVKAYYGFGL